MPSPRPDMVRLAQPEKFDGSADKCKGFLRQCSIYFSHQPDAFNQESAKCAFMMSLLTGKALEWATAVWDNEQIQKSFKYFSQQIKEVFEYPAGGRHISVQLLHLRQGKLCAADYAVQFRTLAAQSGWNDVALKSVFGEGLNPTLQAELATRDESLTLSEYITLTVKIDNLMRNCPRSSAPKPVPVTTSSPVTVSADSDEPMQIGRARVPEEERQRRRDEELCFYCGQPGHLCNACPGKARPPAGSSKRVSITFDTVSGQNFTLPA